LIEIGIVSGLSRKVRTVYSVGEGATAYAAVGDEGRA
jgi:hypothetical protein